MRRPAWPPAANRAKAFRARLTREIAGRDREFHERLAPRLSLFDIQVNGFAGVDFQNPKLKAEDIHRACLALRRRHTHRILLTFITDTVEALEGKFALVESLRAADPLVAETVAGYHLEGPWPQPGGGLSRAPTSPNT